MQSILRRGCIGDKYRRTLMKYTYNIVLQLHSRGYIVATMVTAVYNNYVPTTLVYSDCMPRAEHINNQIADFHLETKRRLVRLMNLIAAIVLTLVSFHRKINCKL